MEKFPPLHDIQCDNLHNLVGDALPSNGEWHTLRVYVRKTEDGVFQVDELLLRRGFIVATAEMQIVTLLHADGRIGSTAFVDDPEAEPNA